MKPSHIGTLRPCEPEDIARHIDKLYRQRRIDLLHARVLRIWGERQAVPQQYILAEKADYRIWKETMAKLKPSLRAAGIVQ